MGQFGSPPDVYRVWGSSTREGIVYLGLPPVERVDSVVPAHEAALCVVFLRLVREHHHDLAANVHALEVVVGILGCP